MWICRRSEVRFGGGAFLLECALPHPHHAVDLAALLHQQPPGREIAVHDAPRLNLDALLGADRAAHFTADDRFASDDVAFHIAPLPHEHLAPGADGAHDRAFYLHHALGRDVSHHAHSGADDGEASFAFGRAVTLLGEDRH